MAYDRIYSHSRSRSRTVQRKNDQRKQLKIAVEELQRLTQIYIRENIDLPRNASNFVRSRICVSCPVDNPCRCESLRDQHNRYYCRCLSREYEAHVRLYLAKRLSPNSAHSRSNMAKKLEDLIRAEPGVRRTRIHDVIKGKWETILDILENDLVYQGRVKRTEKMEKGKKVYQYFIGSDEK